MYTSDNRNQVITCSVFLPPMITLSQLNMAIIGGELLTTGEHNLDVIHPLYDITLRCFSFGKNCFISYDFRPPPKTEMERNISYLRVSYCLLWSSCIAISSFVCRPGTKKLIDHLPPTLSQNKVYVFTFC